MENQILNTFDDESTTDSGGNEDKTDEAMGETDESGFKKTQNPGDDIDDLDDLEEVQTPEAETVPGTPEEELE